MKKHNEQCHPRTSSGGPSSFFLSLVILSLFLASCATAPKQAPFTETDYLPLNDGALVYGTADVVALRPVIEAAAIPALKSRYGAQMLDRSDTAAFAVFSGDEPARAAAQLAVSGDYPAFRANMSLTFTKGWKKHRAGGRPYWHSAADGLSVAVAKDKAFVYMRRPPVNGQDAAAAPAVPAAEPVPPFPASPAADAADGVQLPEGFAAFAKGQAMALWIDNPEARINGFLQKLGLPIQAPAESCFVALHTAPPPEGADTPMYQGRIRLKTVRPAQARALVTLITLARRFLDPGASTGAAGMASLLLTNPPRLEDSFVDIETPPLDAASLALLLRSFSVSFH